MPVTLIPRFTPNYNSRPAGTVINTVVIHADASAKVSSSIAWIRDPASKASYHVIVGRLGDCYALVDFSKRAWHSGKSVFQGEQDVNRFSIGVSFSNKNDGREHYTDAQYRVGAELVRELMQRYPAITLDRITTHAIISPGRKFDPGPLWDMKYFLEMVN